jgi:hypothetical protein
MVEETTPITGGCLCGAVRYEANEPPIETGTCHCRMCQKWTGSAFMVMARFSQTALRFTKGEPKLYRSSSIKEKGFCSNCGSSLFDRYLVRKAKNCQFHPDMIWVQLGTLDHPEVVSIDFHYAVETQLPWVHFDDGLPSERCDEDPELAAAFAAAEAGEE